MATSSKSKQSSTDKIHPETSPTQSIQLGKFVSHSHRKGGKNESEDNDLIRKSRVANMVSAFNARKTLREADGTLRRSVKRTTSAGTMNPASRVADQDGEFPKVHRRRSSSGSRSSLLSEVTSNQVSKSLGRGEMLTVPNHFANGVSSDDDSDGEALGSHHPKQKSTSLGRNVAISTASIGKTLPGKTIDIPIETEEDTPVDTRVQKTFHHFKTTGKYHSDASSTTSPAKSLVIKPIGCNSSGGYKPPAKGPSWKRTSSPRHQGEDSSTKLRPTSNYLPKRSSSPGSETSGKRRIESNPFLQRDRQTRAHAPVKGERKRMDSAPILDLPSHEDTRGNEKSSKTGRSPLDTTLSAARPSSVSSSHSIELNPANSLSVQSRIKLWSDKANEAKYSNEQTSPKHSPRSSPIARRKFQPQKGEGNDKATKEEGKEGKRSSATQMLPVIQVEGHDSKARASSKDSATATAKPFAPHTENKKPPAPGKNQGQAQAVVEDEEYDDIVFLPAKKTERAQTQAVGGGVDAIYDDVDLLQESNSRVPLPTLQGSAAENSEALYEDLYATIPVMSNENGTTNWHASEEVPPALPPRPDNLFRDRSQDAEMGPQNVHESEGQVYEDVELTGGNSPPPNEENPTSPQKRQRKKRGEGKRKWRLLGKKKNDKKGKSEGKNGNSEEVAKNQAENSTGIANRQSLKRKAIKRRVTIAGSDTVDSNYDGAAFQSFDSQANNDQPSENDVYEDVLHRQQRRTGKPTPTEEPKPRSESAPVQNEAPNTESYLTVTSKRLDPESEKIVCVHTEKHTSPPPLMPDRSTTEVAPGKKKESQKATNHRTPKSSSHSSVNRTLSTDLRSLIESMGTSGIQDENPFSPTGEVIISMETSKCVLQSGFLSAPAMLHSSYSDPALHAGNSIFYTPSHTLQSPSPVRFAVSDDSSSDAEHSNSPTADDGEVAETCCPIQSNLDTGRSQRLQLKRQRNISEGSEPGKTIMSASMKEKFLSVPAYERRGSLTPEDETSSLIATPLMYADAVWDRVALENDELGFRVGDVIEILDMTDDLWWHGSVEDFNGWFPASFVRLRIAQESADSQDSLAKPSSTEAPSDDTDGLARGRQPSVKRRMTIRRKNSGVTLPRKLSPSEVRAKCVEEILNTERDYVRHLEDITEGYLKRCREYNKLFDDQTVDTIFSNAQQICNFQRDFLRELEASVNHDKMEESQIGQVFVQNRYEFQIYSEYCNNHPHAVNEMNCLQQNDQYRLFFESCRLLRNLEDISLEGFLLTPVQKICKYPLQLSELLKYTSEDHPDYPHVVAAQQAMKEVAMLINEHKRKMDNIGKIGRWQETIENWKDEDVLETSTELLHSGELHKISKGHSQERHFFLFDHQIIYCKKDAIGGKLSYKGRLSIDSCQIVDLPDGSVLHGSNPVKNAWRMNNQAKDKWYVIYAKSPEVKQQWMEAFKREREKVKEDEEKGFCVSLKMKRAAVALAGIGIESGRRKSLNRKHAVLVHSLEGGVNHRIDSSVPGRKLAVSSGAQLSSGGRKRKTDKKYHSGSPVLPKKIN